MSRLFQLYSSKREWLTAEDLMRFLEVEQGVEDASPEYCSELIQQYEATDQGKAEGLMSVDGECCYTTPHPSPLTRHQVTPHSSPSHSSPLTRDLSLLTHHSSPITPHSPHLAGFTHFLLGPENDLFNKSHKQVYQDMTQPLSHYHIASSHNT